MNHCNELIISSGGVKGYIMLGVLKEIHKHHPLHKFTYYTGTSMGSLLSSLLALGCTLEEMEAILVEIEWFDFLDVKIRYFLDDMGFIETFELQKFIKAVLSYKQISPTITFQELFDQNGKILTIGVTNITKRIGEFHSYLTTPHLSIIQSLMMSISIPILFKPILYQGCLYSDGGIANHFPYYYYKDTKKMGICTMERDLFKEVKEISTQENELFTYMMNIMGTFTDEIIRLKMKEKKTKNTIFIYDQICGGELKIENEMKYKMMEKGIKIGKMFFQKKWKKRRKEYLIHKYISLWKNKCIKK